MKKGIILAVIILQSMMSVAQQWVTQQYTYDSLLNVTYGTALNFAGGMDTLKMDIYTPKCSDPNLISRRPLMIWIHGGAFLAGDKSEASVTNLCKHFAKRGYVTASINYRLGFVSDDLAWNCNYPNYSCVFATDSAEWYRAYYRAVQDGKGALRYLINRNTNFKIDTNNVFISGESAGAILALGLGLLDTIAEKPIQTGAIAAAPLPNSNAFSCSYNVGKTLPVLNVQRPDLGGIEGNIEPSTIHYTIKGIGNNYGAMLSNLLKLKPANKTKPAIFSFHQPCDLVVPMDSGNVFKGISWCMTSGYNCYAIANTAKLYGSRVISNWNTTNSYGYNIHDEFTTTNFPNSFLLGTASCVDQVNNPCHAYDNATLRETNLANFFAPMISSNAPCSGAAVGIQKNRNSDIGSANIYPNPAADILQIEIEYFENCVISITNVTGVLQESIHMQSQKTQVSVRDLSPGIYFISIQKENGSAQSFRFVKE